MMCMHTGKELTVEEDIKQSIGRILLTPKGATVLLRDFGSNLHEYIDRPINLVGPLLGAEVFNTLKRWEPRAKILKVKVLKCYASGEMQLNITYKHQGNTNSLDLGLNN